MPVHPQGLANEREGGVVSSSGSKYSLRTPQQDKPDHWVVRLGPLRLPTNTTEWFRLLAAVGRELNGLFAQMSRVSGMLEGVGSETLKPTHVLLHIGRNGLVRHKHGLFVARDR